MGYPSGSMCGAGALLQHFLCYLQSCPMSLRVQVVAGLPSSFSGGLLSFRPGLSQFLPLTLGWLHQCTSASEAVCYRKLCCCRLPHLLGAMVECADKEKRPVKFVVARANQKRGSLRAGFLCEGECCQESCGESRGLLFRGKSYLLLLAVVSVQALASGREKLYFIVL